ncbi:MAG: hypothetical protein M1837_005741 [Sclerophora amabilis]|nr:MAG: hypothetical protein M1837_005741 [Sclerophora amabilis]
MTKQRPPSPPISNNGDLHYGQSFQHLIQHNANPQYTPESFREQDIDGVSIQTHSGRPSAYNSPTPMVQEPVSRLVGQRYVGYPDGIVPQGLSYRGADVSTHVREAIPVRTLTGEKQRPLHHPYHVSNGIGLDGQYNGYQPSLDYYPPHQGQGFVALPVNQQEVHHQTGHVESPPTPTSSDQDMTGHRTRSGRIIKSAGMSRSSTGTQQSKSKPSKPSKAAKKNTKKPKEVPKLNAPLSELTKDFGTEVKNMDEWVNRSSEQRREEVEARNGYVTRPMNSFMLYRSAYAERTKVWCFQNNHQVVSAVSGQSWPMEPIEVKDKYNELAKKERENHQKAHPGYKFSPSKAQNSAKKRKTVVSEDEQSELSDLDELDYDWGASRRLKNRPKRRREPAREESQSTTSSQYRGSPDHYQPSRGGAVKSSYQTLNPGKPLPAAMANHDLYGQYYQTTVHPNRSVPNVEDVRIRKTDAPGGNPMMYQSLTGMPGGSHQDLIQSQRSSPMPLTSHALDPQLLAYDSQYQRPTEQHRRVDDGVISLNGGYSAVQSEHRYDPVLGSMDPHYSQELLQDYLGQSEGFHYQPLPAFQEGMPVAVDDNGIWHTEPDHGSEFDTWLGENHQG